MLKTYRLDAGLIDAFLPDMSGFELADRAANLNIPVMITSGHPAAISLRRHYSLPYIEKPFSPTTLAEQTINLVRQAETNIAVVVASCARLRERTDDLSKVISESCRLIEEASALTHSADSHREGDMRVCTNGTDSMRVVERVGPEAA